MSNDYSIACDRAAHSGRAVGHTPPIPWPITGPRQRAPAHHRDVFSRFHGGRRDRPAGGGRQDTAHGRGRRAARCGRLYGRVGTTSRSARSIPLRAFAGLLPALERRLPEGVELLARARHALAERAAGGRLVLCVDDGQLLDASAALLHQVVAAREAFAVVSVRRDEPARDALLALWKDELCVRLGLAELSRAPRRTLPVSAARWPRVNQRSALARKIARSLRSGAVRRSASNARTSRPVVAGSPRGNCRLLVYTSPA